MGKGAFEMTELCITSSKESLAEEALKRAKIAVSSTTGPFSIALAGGSTPAPFHRALAGCVDWPWWRTVVLFGDERCVPPDHPDSNYASAKETLLNHVHPMATFRMTGEAEDPHQAAANYETLLRSLPGKQANFVVLGMGGDGHTASLFPNRADVPDRDVIAVPKPIDAPHERLTMTEAFLQRCDVVVVLVSGASKTARLSEVLVGNTDLPLARVLRRRSSKPTIVIADAAAAGDLPAGKIEL